MKYLIYIMGFLFVITISGCDSTKTAKTDASVTKEVTDSDKDTFKGKKRCKRVCENKKECKGDKSCKHKCKKDNEDCQKGECSKNKRKCDKSNKTVNARKCAEGKCGEGKCGGGNTQEDVKEEIDN